MINHNEYKLLFTSLKSQMQQLIFIYMHYIAWIHKLERDSVIWFIMSSYASV